MSEIESKEKFISFIDIIGFKCLVSNAESGSGFTLDEIAELQECLDSPSEREQLETYGPPCCPESRYIARNIDFRLTQISDCAVVSTEISPAGVINLINHCWGVVFRLLQKGVMCRGYISKGPIYHSTRNFIGSGYQNVVEAEKQVAVFKRTADERGTPFVEIDPSVCDYISNCEDACVKKMFGRMTASDGDGVALFPFKRLSHSFIVGGFGLTFDPNKEKHANDNLRKMIHDLCNRVEALVDASNTDAMRKANHYIDALKKQLDLCDQTDEMIDKLCSPLLVRRLT
ncbi:MAG: hypothetical protein HQL94_06080 [Magnetococcales bacterium]|nr:hypothetical protein [Magnetococcales bacterium]MBF0438405.1 hypothetical protein [Magnetococcales bacterium]